MARKYLKAAGARYASRAGKYLRSGPGGVNLEQWLTYGLLGAGLFLAFKVLRFGSQAKDTFFAVTDAAGGAIGRGLYDLFHPSEAEQITSTDYSVYFPAEKKFHAVNSLNVDRSGQFMRSGVVYQIVVPKSKMIAQDGTGRQVYKVAEKA